MKKIKLIAFIVITFSGLSHGQNIDNLYIIPANPSVQDYISIVYDAHFPSSSCELDEWDLTGNGYVLNLTTLHEQGMLSVICYSSETIPVGNLAAGNYTLNLTVSIPGSSVSSVINFTVSNIVSVEVTNPETTGFLVFPNPAEDVLHISQHYPAPLPQYSLIMKTLYGKEVFKQEQISDQRFTFSTTGLPKGIYILEFIPFGKSSQYQKILIQ
jgi:hypothetical protein